MFYCAWAHPTHLTVTVCRRNVPRFYTLTMVLGMTLMPSSLIYKCGACLRFPLGVFPMINDKYKLAADIFPSDVLGYEFEKEVGKNIF